MCLVLLTGIYAYSTYNSDYKATEQVRNGDLTWSGGVNDKYVYSELEDKNDDKDWKGRVWVKNSLCKVDYVETLTYLQENGRFNVSIKKAWFPGLINKAGYKNINRTNEID